MTVIKMRKKKRKREEMTKMLRKKIY